MIVAEEAVEVDRGWRDGGIYICRNVSPGD